MVISEVNKFLLGTDCGIRSVEKCFYQFSVNVVFLIVVIFGQHISQLTFKQQLPLVILIDMIPPDKLIKILFPQQRPEQHITV
jgi:hypothetical protein